MSNDKTQKLKLKLTMKTNLVLTLLTIFVSQVVSAQQFTPNDVRIGDTTVNYVNPEISPTGNYMLWIEVDTTNGVSCKVWQCGIDSNTGNLIPSDGKGFNPFFSNVYARPADWGVDSLGVYYVGATFAGQLKFVRPTSPTSAIVTDIPMPIMNKRRVFYPSQLPNENKRFVSYILNDSINGLSLTTPQNTYYQLRLLDLDNPANDYLIEQQASNYPGAIPMDIIVPRWMKGTHYLTYGFKDAQNKIQAKELNAYTPLTPPVAVTNDLATKVDGYPVINPLTNEQYLMSGINNTDSAFFYKRTSFGSMFTYNETVVPQSVHLINPALNQSHEPFFFNNQLFSTFQVNERGINYLETTLNKPGEIWMTTIDRSPRTMWLLSEFDSTLNISEPEPYVGNNKVWVYYSAVKIDTTKPLLKRHFQLRRCETPINQLSASKRLKENKLQIDYNLFQNYPNPFNPTTTIRFSIPKTEYVNLQVFDVLGKKIITLIDKEVPSGEHSVTFDAHNLSSGIYFYQLKTNNVVIHRKMILAR